MNDGRFRRKHGQPDRPRQASTIRMPPAAAAHARLIFAELRRQNVRYWEFEERSGIIRATLKSWRKPNRPVFTSLEAAANSLNFNLVAIERRELPQGLRDDLIDVAQRHREIMAETVGALQQIVAERSARARAHAKRQAGAVG